MPLVVHLNAILAPVLIDLDIVQEEVAMDNQLFEILASVKLMLTVLLIIPAYKENRCIRAISLIEGVFPKPNNYANVSCFYCWRPPFFLVHV